LDANKNLNWSKKESIESSFQNFAENIKDIHFLKEGWRGKIFFGYIDNKKVAVKVAKFPYLIKNIKKEAEVLRKVNKKNIGPKILLEGSDFFVMEFIDGIPFKKILDEVNTLSDVFFDILYQARELDRMKISKNEMHKPYNNAILCEKENKVVLIDFESSQFTEKPKNVTQFVSFLLSFLKTKGKIYPKEEKTAIELMKNYKRDYSDESFKEILNFLKDFS
jgi:putative serine/threonine protein kinase